MKKLVWEKNNQLVDLDKVEAWMPAAAVQLSRYYASRQRKSQEKFRKRFLRIMKEANGNQLQCAFCGVSGLSITSDQKHPNQATIDHFIPISKGGERWDMTNLVVACKKCNKSKGNLSGDNLIVWIEKKMKEMRKKALRKKAKKIRRLQRAIDELLAEVMNERPDETVPQTQMADGKLCCC